MLREAAALALVLSLALAGCLGAPAAPAPDEGAPEVSPAADAPRQAPDASPAPPRSAPAASAAAKGAAPDAASASWHVLDATAGPDAALTAAWWTMPARALVTDDFFPDEETLVLEAALLAPEGGAPDLTEWAVFTFHERKGTLALVHEIVATPVAWSGMMALNPVDQVSGIDPPAPFLIDFSGNGVEAGDRVAFVVAARSPEPAPVRFAFRALAVDEGVENRASEDAASFVKARGADAPGALAAAGTASGFQAAQYLEVNAVLLLPYSYVATSGPVEVVGGASPDARPAAAARDLTTTIRFPGSGWTHAYAIHFGGDGVGQWTAAADAHGTQVSGGGPSVRAWNAFGANLATSMLVGLPSLGAIGEGEGESSTTFHVEGASVSAGTAEMIVHAQVDLGATLDALLGTPSDTGAHAGGGLLSSGALQAGFTPAGDLVVLHPWGSQVWRGVAPGEAS